MEESRQPPATAMAVETEDLVLWVDGARLAARWLRPYALAHSPQRALAEPFVLLHEGLGCIALWRDFPVHLAAATGRAVLVYDRRGFGRSDPLADERAPGYLEYEAEVVLPAVLAAVGIERPLLFGHSDGGSIALLYAAARPQELVGAIVEAAHVEVDRLSLSGIREARLAYHERDLAARLARYHGDKTDQLFRNWADLWLSDAFAGWNMTARLPAITAPLLVIQGTDDEYGLPDQVTRIASGVSGPVETAFIPDCRHVPHLQAEAAVMALTLGFLSRLAGGSADDRRAS